MAEIPGEIELGSAVAYVRKHGDAIDQLRWTRRVRGMASLTLGAIVVGAYLALDNFVISEYIHYLYPPLAATAVGTAIGQRAQMWVARRRQNRRANNVLQQFEELSTMGHGGLEIYRSRGRSKNIALRWYAQQDLSKSEIGEHLGALAELATATNTDAIVLPHNAVQEWLHKSDEYGHPISQKNWLRKTKKLVIDKPKTLGADELIELTPAQARELTERIEKQTPEQKDDVAQLFELLRTVDPKHSLLKWQPLWLQGGQGRASLLLPKVRRQIESRLDEVGAKKDWDEDRTHREKAAIYLGGSVSLPHVGAPQIDWLQDRGQQIAHETSNLITHTGVRRGSLVTHITNEGVPASQRVRSIEVALWMALQKRLEPVPNVVSATAVNAQPTNDSHSSATNGLQRQIVEHTLGRPRAVVYRRPPKGLHIHATDCKVRSVLVAFAIVGAATVVISRELNIYNARLNSAYNAQLNRIDALSGPDQFDAIANGAFDSLERSTEREVGRRKDMWVAGQTEKGLANLQDAADSFVTKLSIRAGFSADPKQEGRFDHAATAGADRQLSAAVGNVSAGGKSEPEWYINRYGNMSASGYWPESLFDQLSQQTNEVPRVGPRTDNPLDPAVEWEESLGPESFKPSKANFDVTELPLPDTNVAPKRLVVQRPAAIRDLGRFYENIDQLAIPIPVLEGTQVVAASFETDGNKTIPFEHWKTPAGTDVLLLPKRYAVDDLPPGMLTYVLTPGAQSRVHATGPIRIPDGNRERLVNSLTAIWAKHNLKLPEDEAQRVAFTHDYLASFHYALAPLPDNSNSYRLFEDATEFVDAVLTELNANCNTANTTLAMTDANSLNYVTGYSNSIGTTGKVQYLSSPEAHAWTVDKKGNIVDATPSDVKPNEAKFFNENFGHPKLKPDTSKQRRQTTRYIAIAVGMTALLGTAIRFRRRIREAIRKTQRRHAESQIAGRPTVLADRAAQALTYVMYPPEADGNGTSANGNGSKGNGLGETIAFKIVGSTDHLSDPYERLDMYARTIVRENSTRQVVKSLRKLGRNSHSYAERKATRVARESLRNYQALGR